MPALQDAVREALTAAFLQHDVTVSGKSVNDIADAITAHLDRSAWTLVQMNLGEVVYSSPAINGDRELQFLALAALQLDQLAPDTAARAVRYLTDRYTQPPEETT